MLAGNYAPTDQCDSCKGGAKLIFYFGSSADQPILPTRLASSPGAVGEDQDLLRDLPGCRPTRPTRATTRRPRRRCGNGCVWPEQRALFVYI